MKFPFRKCEGANHSLTRGLASLASKRSLCSTTSYERMGVNRKIIHQNEKNSASWPTVSVCEIDRWVLTMLTKGVQQQKKKRKKNPKPWVIGTRGFNETFFPFSNDPKMLSFFQSSDYYLPMTFINIKYLYIFSIYMVMNTLC